MRRGTRIGQAYVAVSADGDGINEEIVNSVDEAGPGVEKAGDEHGRRYGDKFSKGFLDRIRERFGKKVGERLNESMDGEEAGKHLGSDIVQGLRKRLEDSHNDIKRLMDRLLAAEDAGRDAPFLANLSHALRSATNDATLLERELRSAMEAEGLLNRARGGGGGGVSGNGGRDNDRMGDMVGRLFGAGSRNNFLNIMGKSLGNIVNLFETAATGAGKFFTTFSRGMSAAGEEASLLQKVMGGFAEFGTGAGGGISKMFSSLAASGPGAVVAVVAITAALSVMASVVGALVGLLTALVATIAGALVGATLVLGGALGAVVVAGGLLVNAFTSMTDAQKKLLTDAFRPLKAELVGIGQIMLEQMVPAFSVWSANLQQALMLAVPVAHVMGQAFADAGSIITAAFSGPGFQMLSTQLAIFLPGIITKLSFALGQFLNGLAGMFAALLPFVDRFAGYLGRVATTFAAWATSAQGQNSIAEFVTRAVTSLQSLWNFVSAFSGFLFKVLFSPEAANAGNSIFDSMAKTFRSFTQKIAQAQADGSLKKWFNDAIKFGGQLWKVIQALWQVFMALYSSGVLNAVGKGLGFLAFQIKLVAAVAAPLIQAFNLIGRGLDWLNGKFHNTASGINQSSNGIFNAANTIWAASGIITNAMHRIDGASANSLENPATNPSRQPSFSLPSMGSLQAAGTTALNNTSIANGGYRQPHVRQPKQYHNPYKKWAESLIKDGPSTSAQIKNAMLTLNKAAAAGILAAAKETGGKDGIVSAMDTMMSNLRTGGAEAVNTARSALNSAASSLASATSKSAAQRALRQVKSAQKSLRAALKDQSVLNSIAHNLASQKVVKQSNIDKMVAGIATTNITLAEFAVARSILADKITAANQKLSEAISLRDDYNKSVTDSIKSFGALATAQAQTVDGVEQALTAGDITTNLQDRLDKIKKFQSDLQLLLAQGLSNDAYKQIVDEGVTNGTALADALLAGGSSAIQNTNSLVDQINGIAGSLGAETSNRLYQAGVDAAQGLVDGLTSLSAQLDSAAYKLGTSIAASIKKALGIKSPSTVLRDMMNYVGDGAVLGLNDQHVKVGSAASALADVIAVNPGAPRPTTTSEEAVSGNGSGQKFRDLIVQTPTEDPQAVAHEVLNEVVGRL